MVELDHAVILCNIPTKDELMDTSTENPLKCNDVRSFTIELEQSVYSYNEQKNSIMMNQKVIYSYLEISFNDGEIVVKCIGTHGYPGSGKYSVEKYSSIYVISKGLRIISTSVVARRSLNLGDSHIH